MTTVDSLITDYLARLEQVASTLPPDRRAELLEGISDHIDAARAAGDASLFFHTGAGVRRHVCQLPLSGQTAESQALEPVLG